MLAAGDWTVIEAGRFAVPTATVLDVKEEGA